MTEKSLLNDFLLTGKLNESFVVFFFVLFYESFFNRKNLILILFISFFKINNLI